MARNAGRLNYLVAPVASTANYQGLAGGSIEAAARHMVCT